MKYILLAGFIATCIFSAPASAQKQLKKSGFFSDTSMLTATLTFNMKIFSAKRNNVGCVFPGMFACKLGDSISVNDPVSLEIRGHFRRGYCDVEPLKVNFRGDPSGELHHLKSLKLVNACMVAKDYDQYLLKEYLCYKLYNLVTEKSFRVHLLNLTYRDSSGKKKPFTQHAFLLESIKELAKRNGLSEWRGGNIYNDGAERQQTTTVTIFEYMISNTDWSISSRHNIDLVLSDANARPYAIPYDFDSSGIVNADYALPDRQLGIQNVRERLYRGFPRTMEELNEALVVFKDQRDNMYAIVNNCGLLTADSRNEMIQYLDEFFKQINDAGEVKRIFITDARK
jgi:hypothetical protein